MTKPRVLVVDDEAAVVMLCTYVLTDAGYDVESATRADEARALIESRPYDVYLIDLVMPDLGGLQSIRAARRVASPKPIVVMTAEPEHLVPTREGMDYYLHKPFRGLDALEEVIAEALRNGRRQPAASEPAQAG